MAKLARAGDLVEPVRQRVADGMPILGTCAGMIVLAKRVKGGDPLFGLFDITVQRNAYGRQVESFETDVDVEGIDHAVRGVFIRAPRVEDLGPGVRVLAEHEGHAVVLEQANLLVASFHPELVGETGLHDYLLRKV
jgi:5'-phosphate synthase pdxT subunit